MRTHPSRRADPAMRRSARACPDRASGEPEPAEVADVVGYIADMAAQLERMALAANVDLLAYFLSMARAEAETVSRRLERS